jgi:hypothetical protein
MCCNTNSKTHTSQEKSGKVRGKQARKEGAEYYLPQLMNGNGFVNLKGSCVWREDWERHLKRTVIPPSLASASGIPRSLTEGAGLCGIQSGGDRGCFPWLCLDIEFGVAGSVLGVLCQWFVRLTGGKFGGFVGRLSRSS